MEKFMLPCLNKQILGFECLGCGIQRALVLLFHGEFVAAFMMYPAIYPLLLLALTLGYSSFFKLKYSSIISTVLASITVLTVLISYSLKHFL